MRSTPSPSPARAVPQLHPSLRVAFGAPRSQIGKFAIEIALGLRIGLAKPLVGFTGYEQAKAVVKDREKPIIAPRQKKSRARQNILDRIVTDRQGELFS
jgi:hypothetical protein